MKVSTRSFEGNATQFRIEGKYPLKNVSVWLKLFRFPSTFLMCFVCNLHVHFELHFGETGKYKNLRVQTCTTIQYVSGVRMRQEAAKWDKVPTYTIIPL